MSQYSEKLIELLHNDYPDLSGWTIICASDRAVDPVQHFIHTELGGILPRVEGLKSYIIRKSSEELNLEPVPGDEQLLYFIRFVAEKFPNEPYPARRAVSLLPVIAKLAEYKISRNTIYGAERFTDDEWTRLEEYLETAQAFRKWLAKLNFFMPELEIAAVESVTPGEKEVFIGLPAITPVTERLCHKIKKKGCSSIRRCSEPNCPDRKNCRSIRRKILPCPSAAGLRPRMAQGLNWFRLPGFMLWSIWLRWRFPVFWKNGRAGSS